MAAPLRVLEPRPQELGDAVLVVEHAQRVLVQLRRFEVVRIVVERVAQHVERVVVALEVLDQELRVLDAQRVALRRA